MSITVPGARLPVGNWESDPIHSTVAVSAHHMVPMTSRTSFETVGARLTVADDGEATLSGTVRSESITIRDRDVATQLSAELLEIRCHPELRLASISLRRAGDRIDLAGHLTIQGRTLMALELTRARTA